MISPHRKRTQQKSTARGQTSIEFLVLLGFMLLVFTAFYFVIQERLTVAQQEQNYNDIVAVADTINQEISFANLVHDGYNRTFELPRSLNGEAYDATLNGHTEVYINTSEYGYILFLPTNVTIAGGMKFGVKNLVAKRDGIITIFPNS